MIDKNIIHIGVGVSIFLSFLFSLTLPALGYVASSTNYRLQFDSINNGGGMGTSTNYKIEDTVGEIATGLSTSTNYNLKAGYQQMDPDVLISITAPSSVVLLPNIGGITGGTANTTSDVGVLTNNRTGYSLYIKASSSPALQSGVNSFLNYADGNIVPDFQWSIPATSSAFGFSPESINVVQKYLDNGVVCNQGGGSDSVDRCWYYFPTVNELISQSAVSNYPVTVTTTVKLRAESGNQHIQTAGTYTATIVVTAVTN